MPGLHPMKGQRKAPPSPERLAQAARLFADGASQREVQRTTGIAYETLRKHFPGQGWTYRDGGNFRALTRHSPIQLKGTP